MKTRATKTIAKIFDEGTIIDEALNQAVQDAIEQHRKAGLPMAVWKNGKTVWIQPDDIGGRKRGREPLRRSQRPMKRPGRKS